MACLIDADALKKAMDGYWGRCQRIRKPRNGETAVFLDIKAIVEDRPTIDAVPVRHGKWTRHTLGSTGGYGTTVMHQCSECESMTISRFRYCPTCGARMDEE